MRFAAMPVKSNTAVVSWAPCRGRLGLGTARQAGGGVELLGLGQLANQFFAGLVRSGPLKAFCHWRSPSQGGKARRQRHDLVYVGYLRLSLGIGGEEFFDLLVAAAAFRVPSQPHGKQTVVGRWVETVPQEVSGGRIASLDPSWKICKAAW